MQLSEALKFLEALNVITNKSNFSEVKTETEESQERDVLLRPFLGKKVLIRAHRKGVQVGILKSTDKEFAYLKNSRKLWRWQATEGVALESVVSHGISDGTRATGICQDDALRLDDICGITVISDARWDQIMDWPISEQN